MIRIPFAFWAGGIFITSGGEEMHIIRKFRRMCRLIADGKYEYVKGRIKFLIKSNVMYSRLCREYRQFIAEHTRAESLSTMGRGHDDIIWWCWLQGLDSAPEVCKACLKSLQRWHPDKKIITLDQSNLHEYITLPDYIERKHKDGIIAYAHYSDIVRTQILVERGGTWIDSTVYCTGRRQEYIMRLPFFVFRDDNISFLPHGWDIAPNWFIVSDPGNPIMLLMRDILFDYWRNNDHAVNYYMYYMFLKMAVKAHRDEWRKVPFVSALQPQLMSREMFDDYSDARMKYFEGISDFHKLNHKFNPSCVAPSSILQHVIDSYK